VRHIKNATGTVERLSVAVLINERAPTVTKNDKGEITDSKPNPYSDDEITRMQDLVAWRSGLRRETRRRRHCGASQV
jgi:flagellar biosynthesis/type III secretory pathway M-ring protein FliF/YscJ